ncbi:hypothetical protein AB0J72_45315 [Dactylosporangium sp. NPDC049742]|uniref:hypothetical protein n=1 Tax=Dactylosporangium sp. NPDC049742 TaxID=3154737 RepID=UPI0034186C30
MYEYDIAFWDPAATYRHYDAASWREHYSGFASFRESESAQFVFTLTRRRTEFEEFVKMGRVLVILTAAPQIMGYDTGKRTQSGTGKAVTTHRHIEFKALQDALPFKFRAVQAKGSRIDSPREDFGALLRKYPDRWWYRAILDSPVGLPLAVVAGTDKVVGSINKGPGGGIILQLPDLPIIDDGYNEDEDEDDDESDIVDDPDPLYVDLIEWIRQLRGGGESTLPKWAEDLQFGEDIARGTQLFTLEQELQQLMAKIAELRAERARDDRWKHLITSSGTQLEERVGEAFALFGFDLSPPVAGRRDLHLTWQGRTAVVEVKGIKKSAAEANAAQLEKWVSSELSETGKIPKGILVVNGWREIPITQRTEILFPHQMLQYSVAREHCLLSGFQILTMVRAVIRGDVQPEDVAGSIMSCIGVMPGWESITDVFPDGPLEVVHDSEPENQAH